MIKKLLASLACLFSTSLFAAYPGSNPIISQTELQQLQSSGERIIVLDVRSLDEYNESHVPGAINIPHTEMANKIEKLITDKQQSLVVYCRSGYRASLAEKVLAEKGYDNVKHLDGDMKGWLEKGLPTEKLATSNN